MMLYSTQSFCFDNPADPTDKYLLPALEFVSDAPAWIKDTTLWKLATKNLPNNPAKIIVVNNTTRKIIENEGGDPTKIQNNDSVVKNRTRGAKAPNTEPPAKEKSGVVEVTANGGIINNGSPE
jgi:hypothetical protein